LTAVTKKKGQSSALLLGQLRPYLRTLGMVSLLLVGIGMLLEAASAYLGLAYAFYQ